MDTGPGADELRMKAILKKRGVGPDAVPPAVPPKPAGRPKDWLDDILDSPPTPIEEDEAPEPEPEPAADTAPAEARKPTKTANNKRKRKRKRPKPGQARTAWDTRPPSPRQSLIDAWDQVPYRLKWLAYHAAAAYLGWSVGLVDWCIYVTAWIAATGLIGVQAFLWYGAAALTFLLYRRTRRAWFPVAWLAAVPAVSTVVGVLLYAPTQ